MIGRDEINKITDILRNNFPKAFPAEKPVLLKKGIHLDISASGVLEVSNVKLRQYLISYTKSFKYLKAHKEGAKRYDLNGDIAGEVTLDEMSYAKELLAIRNKKRAEYQSQKAEVSTEEPSSNKKATETATRPIAKELAL